MKRSTEATETTKKSKRVIESKTLFDHIPAEISDIIMSLAGDVGLVIMTNVCRMWKTIILKSFHNHFISKNKFIENAAKMGYLSIVKWAREIGCRWNYSTCSNAARKGHKKILKWAQENGCPKN